MPYERPPATGTAPGTTNLEFLKIYRPPKESVRKWLAVTAQQSLSDVAKEAGYDVKTEFWKYIDYVFPGCGQNPECVNWYLKHRYDCPPTWDGKNRKFRGGESLPLPKFEWKYGKPPEVPVTPAGFYNRQAAVGYALNWALSFNPAFPETHNGSDCSNFVSQCLLAGGWKMVRGGTLFDVSDLFVWWHAELTPGGPVPEDSKRYSWTWGAADNLAHFLHRCGRAFKRGKFEDLQGGDVFFEFDLKRNCYSHAMFVVARTYRNGEQDLQYAQHSDPAIRWFSEKHKGGRHVQYPDKEFHWYKVVDSFARARV
jgi:hypothetical protein